MERRLGEASIKSSVVPRLRLVGDQGLRLGAARLPVSERELAASRGGRDRGKEVRNGAVDNGTVQTVLSPPPWLFKQEVHQGFGLMKADSLMGPDTSQAHHTIAASPAC